MTVFLSFCVNERTDEIGLFLRNGERLYRLKTLLNDEFFLCVWLIAYVGLTRAAVVAVKPAMAYRTLCWREVTP